MEEKPKHAGGRPSTYKPEYCETIQALGAKGYSLVEMAAELNVVKQTLFNWCSEHPEFLAAMGCARIKSQAWWEKLGREHVIEGKDDDKINASLYSRSMSARFPDDWRENSSVEVSGKDGGAIKTEDVSMEEAAKRLAFLFAAATAKQDEKS